MAYQVRSSGGAGATGAYGSAAPVAPTAEKLAFRSTRNEMASTLKAGAAIAHESRSSNSNNNAAAAAGGRGASGAASYASYSASAAAPAASSSTTILPVISSATPRTVTRARGAPHSAGSVASPQFPSTDKEETKEGGGGASAAAAGAGGISNKERDWHLWNGAPEAQWILSVMDDISHKLQLASLLHPDLLKDRSMDSMDAELLLTLKEHFQVEAQYHEFLDSDLWKMGATEPKNRELFRELDLCLADSTRTVTRLLKQQPGLVRRLRELGVKRNPATVDFLNTFARLRGLMHAQLHLTAEEERHMREQLAELKVLEEEDTARFVELTERLAVERSEHEQALAAKERKIERLQAQISQLQSRTASERQMFEERMAAENEVAERAFKASEKDLLRQLEALHQQLETDGSENFRTELLYHRRKNLRALDVTNLIERYDVDMQLKHDSVVDMAAVADKERAELEQLTGYFATRDAEDARIAAEHVSIRAERDRELVEGRKNQAAALLVAQGMYRPFLAKHGPKEPKAKKTKKKKDPWASIRKEANAARATSAQARAASATSTGGGGGAGASSSAAAAAKAQQQHDAGNTSDGGMLSSPAASGPEDSEGEAGGATDGD